MINLLPAKKGKGIDDLISSLSPAPPEETKRATYTTSSIMSDVMQEYRDFWRAEENRGIITVYDSYDGHDSYFRFLIEKKCYPRLLKPAEINVALQMILNNAPEENSTPSEDNPMPGIFTSILIQNSYRAGYNGFFLDFTNAVGPYPNVGSYLAANIKRGKMSVTPPIQVTVRGDMGEDFAQGAVDVDFTIEGTIKGNIGGRDCIFRTPNPATGHYLNQHVPPGNKIIRICLDGTQITVRNFDERYYPRKY